jgi:hypothetical protein
VGGQAGPVSSELPTATHRPGVPVQLTPWNAPLVAGFGVIHQGPSAPVTAIGPHGKHPFFSAVSP